MTLKVSFRCKGKEECVELIDHLTRAKGVNASIIRYKIRNSSVQIVIFGSSVEAHETRRALIKAYKEWRILKGWMSKGEYITSNQLIRFVGKPFPIDALIEVLKVLGYGARKDGEHIIFSGVDWNYVMSVAQKLAELLELLARVKPKATYSAKCLITAFSFLEGVSIESALQILKEKGVLKEEGVKLETVGEWRSLLRKLV